MLRFTILFLLVLILSFKQEAGYIGFTWEPNTSGKGVVIIKVMDKTPAQKAGLKARDILKIVDKLEITNGSEFVKYIKNKRPGDIITLEISRDGKEIVKKLMLWKRPKTDATDEYFSKYEKALNKYQEKQQREQELFKNLISSNEELYNSAAKKIKKIGHKAINLVLIALRDIKPENNKLLTRISKLLKYLVTNTKNELPELFKKLDDDDPEIRDYAAKRLIEIGKVAHVYVKHMAQEELQKAKKQNNFEVQLRCENILEKIKKSSFSKKWSKSGKCKGEHKKEKNPVSFFITCLRCKLEKALGSLCNRCADELGICSHCQKVQK